MEKPQRMADLSDCPLTRNPRLPKKACPTRMEITNTRMGPAYDTMICGSTSMPTDTKKMAPKRFFTGSTTLMILSASIVSARTEPMTKAPKALLNPARVETTAMRQQSPSDTMSNVSLLMSFRKWRSSRGMRKMPTTNHSTRKNPMRPTLPRSIMPPEAPPLAMAASITIMTMARISSRMSTLITRLANC